MTITPFFPQARNELIPNSGIEDQWRISVHCKLLLIPTCHDHDHQHHHHRHHLDHHHPNDYSDKPEVTLTRDDGERVIREGEDLRYVIIVIIFDFVVIIIITAIQKEGLQYNFRHHHQCRFLPGLHVNLLSFARFFDLTIWIFRRVANHHCHHHHHLLVRERCKKRKEN